MKIPNKRKIQLEREIILLILIFKDFMRLYKDYTKEPFSFLVNDTTLL